MIENVVIWFSESELFCSIWMAHLQLLLTDLTEYRTNVDSTTETVKFWYEISTHWFFFFNESISDFQFLFCTAKHSLILGHRKIEDHCGGLSETGPHRLIYVKAWSPVGRTVLERIRRYGIFKGNFEVSTAHDVANLIFSLPFSLPFDKI